VDEALPAADTMALLLDGLAALEAFAHVVSGTLTVFWPSSIRLASVKLLSPSLWVSGTGTLLPFPLSLAHPNAFEILRKEIV
jgi:hypothetical protein